MNITFRKHILNLAKCVHYCTKVVSAQGNLMSNMLGIDNGEAQEFVQKHNLCNVDTIRLAETLKFITTFNINLNECLQIPKVFSYGGRRIEQTYIFYKECGCKNISITDLMKHRKISGYSIKKLKELKFLPKNVNVAKNLVGYLNPPPPNLDISDLENEDLSLGEIHSKIINRYLEYRLEAEEEDIEKISRIHQGVYAKPMKYICDNINIALSLGYTKKKILRNAYIMSVTPKITQEVLETLPELAGTDLATQMFRYPKLIGISVQDILRIYELLRKENISDEAIKRYFNIFTLSPTTIQKRLKDIKRTPETRVLMHNPRMLSLIIHYHCAKTRLKFLQSIKLRCASLLVVGIQGEKFENHVKEGKDVHAISDTDRFLKVLVKADENDELKYRMHPYHLHVPLVDIEDTFYYLKRNNFSNKSIRQAIQILLYPKEKISAVLEKIKSDMTLKSRAKRITRVQKLNLALYLLEKDHHFSGNGIWKNDNDPELL